MKLNTDVNTTHRDSECDSADIAAESSSDAFRALLSNIGDDNDFITSSNVTQHGDKIIASSRTTKSPAPSHVDHFTRWDSSILDSFERLTDTNAENRGYESDGKSEMISTNHAPGEPHRTIMEFPEVEMLVDEMRHRLRVVDEIISSVPTAVDGQSGQVAKEMFVSITPEQKDAITGISSNFRGLIRCLNHHHHEYMLLESKTHEESDDLPSRRSSLTTRSSSAKHIINSAKTPSSKILVHNILEVDPAHRRHLTVSPSNDGMTFLSKLPKELLVEMMNHEQSCTTKSSVAFIAQTFGGVELPINYQKGHPKPLKNIAKKVAHSNSFVRRLKDCVSQSNEQAMVDYIPIEFSRLDMSKRRKLTRMLSWDCLKSWGFDSFELDKLTSSSLASKFPESPAMKAKGCPLVLIGWALFASPYSQLAMARNTNDNVSITEVMKAIRHKSQRDEYPFAQMVFREMNESPSSEGCSATVIQTGYFFLDKFGITPKALCRFLRTVEKEYQPRTVNPYHNNIHGADVLQSTHALIQMGGDHITAAFTSLEVYTILLAASLHDVQHPGTNNNYQINKQTELAMLYNDRSVLENMHASRASHLLTESTTDEDASGGIFGRMNEKDRKQIRVGIIRSILGTDMSYHFKSVSKMNHYLDRVLEEIEEERETTKETEVSVLSRIGRIEHPKLREKLLPFILHIADISNPAKALDLSIEWSNCAYDEFFLQGDKEAREDMPISPLCDRSITIRADGQVGFITYVVKPAFLLLHQFLPDIDCVLKQLEDNLEYWLKEKSCEMNTS